MIFSRVPAALAGLVLLLVGTAAYGASNSLPGDKLFALRRGYENLQVQLETNPEQRATLQLQIASQRLADAQKVVENSDNDSAKQKAIEELTQQTVVALNNIKAVAPTLSNENKTILQRAEALTNDKNTLVAKVTPQNAEKAQEETKVAMNEIRNLLAASNEESSAAIEARKDVTASGLVTAVTGKTITVKDVVFTVDTKTITVHDADGKDIEFSSITVNDTVEIKGKVQEEMNAALNITVTAKTKTAAENKDKTDKIETPKPVAPKKPVTPTPTPGEEPNTEPAPQKVNDTFGGFIPEPAIEVIQE